MITPGRLWYLFQRERKRGLFAAWAANITLPKIIRWRIHPDAPEATTPVATLTGANDWLLCLWMLASWHHFTGKRWPVVVMEDGTLPEDARAVFESMFPGVRILTPEEDPSMLSGYPACRAYRQAHPLARKIFDLPHAVGKERFLLIDSDVLFYRRPQELLDWADSDSDACWFNEDAAEGSLVTSEEARTKAGVDLWPRVNSGLAAIHAPMIDLDFCEFCLKQTPLLSGHIWRVEQTLFALCASRHGKGGLLPPAYEVSLGKTMLPDVIARHYVGAVRDRFHGEGVRRLAPVLLR